MKSLLKVQTWPDWDPLGGLGVDDITDAGVATALAFLGIFLWLAAIGHVLVYLARAASLLVLTATGPLAAAGLVSDFTRSWFWKSLRWFHAAAFTPVLMVMVLGIGVQFANGVAAHLADGTAKAFGTALPAVMTILISVVAPLALFKLLAFVDPGTPSGASFRQGMAIQGGLQGLLERRRRRWRLVGCVDHRRQRPLVGRAERRGLDRRPVQQVHPGRPGQLRPGRPGVATGMGWINSAGAKATSLMSDETNQAGVGQSTYGPDFSGLGGTAVRWPVRRPERRHPPRVAEQRRPATTTRRCRPRRRRPRRPPRRRCPPAAARGGGSGGQGGGGAGAAPKTPAAGGGGGAAGGAGGAAQQLARSPRWRCSRCAARPATRAPIDMQ